MEKFQKKLTRFFIITLFLTGFAQIGLAQDVLLNGNFEGWDDATHPTSWTKAENVAQESTAIHGGAFSAKHTGDGTKDLSQTIAVTGGASYTLTLWYKVESGDGTDARIWSNWKSQGNNLTDHAAELKGPNNSYFDSNGNAWSSYEVTLTAPATADEFYYEVRAYGSAVVYWDDFSFVNNSGGDPTLTVSPSTLTGFTYLEGAGPSAEQTFSLLGLNLDGTDVILTPSVNYEISKTTGTGFVANPSTLTYTAFDGTATTVYVRLKAGLSVNDYNGETITIAGGGDADGVTVSPLDGSVIVPATTTIPYLEEFTTDLGDMYAYSVSGDTKEWYHESDKATMNGYTSGDTEEDWLILPGINLDNYANEFMNFNSWWQYGNEDTDNYLKLVYSTNYSGFGDPSTATWTELTFTQPALAEEWASSGDIDLSAIVGTSVHIAFKYNYTDGNYRRWSVDDINISTDGGGATCADAVTITAGTHNSIHAIGDDYDQWFKFVATIDGTATVENCASNIDAFVVIEQGSCGTGLDLQDDECGTSGLSVNLTFNITNGTTYFIGWGNYDQGTAPEYEWTLTETSSLDANSTVEAPTTQVAAANISSLFDETSEAVPVFTFDIKDAGTSDVMPTEVTQITIKAGANNNIDWTTDIAGGYLYKESTSSPLTITTAPVFANGEVTFYIDDTELDVADGGSESITFYAYLGTTVTDNAIIECMIDADAHGFVADPAGSLFAADFGTDVTGNQQTIDVAATELVFTTQPTNVVINTAMAAVEVSATDANGNVDLDYVSQITLTTSGTGMTANPFTSVSGVATFSDIVFNAEQTGINITASDGSFTDVVSNNFNVTAVPGPVTKLLLTEVVVTPTAGEYIEIHNPGTDAINLSDYYLTDATNSGNSEYYYNITTGANYGGSGYDFHARFPDGATIAGGEVQTIAIKGSDNFYATYSVNPTYELYEDAASADAIPDMREAGTGSINDDSGLSNGGEVVILYYWDGTTDLVTDIDYLVWGDKNEAVDKSGVVIGSGTYQNDTPIADQEAVAEDGHANESSWQRADLTEGTQTTTGGNGVDGRDETSENVSVTWVTSVATPNELYSTNPTLSITAPTNNGIVYSVDVDITFAVENFTVATATNGDGHIVYTLDAGTPADHFTTDPISLTALSEAEHTVALELVDDSGNSLDPAVTETVTFTVQLTIPTVTIYDIQYTTETPANSPYVDQAVTTTGIVTAVGDGSYFIQDDTGEWNGIYVYDSENIPAIGDEITLTGLVAEYFELTQLKTITSFAINSSGNTLPAVSVIQTTDMGESYEGVFISFQDATCTNVDLGDGMWEITQGTTALPVDDNIFDYTPAVNQTYSVSGMGYYSYDEYKVLPRFASDIIDNSAPSYIIDYPAATNIGTTSFDVEVQLDEEGTAYYVVVDGSATAPTVAEVLDGQQSGGSAAIASGTMEIIIGTTTYTDNVTGLTSETIYDVYFVAQDAAITPNVQATVTLIDDVTTLTTDIETLSESNTNIYSHNNNIYVNFEFATKANISVYDIAGRLVCEKESNNDENIIEINANEGIYLVKIKTNEGVITQKVFIK